MLNYILVGLGSAAGGMSRYWASGLAANRFGQSIPFSTLFVNVTGSFIIGFFATVTAVEERWLVSPSVRNCFMTGFCGYTTFSSFSLQTLNLAHIEEWFYASSNTVLNLISCLVGPHSCGDSQFNERINNAPAT
jgi:fluoride exporter